MKKRPYRNGEIWDFEAEMGVREKREQQVILGLDGGTTNSVCVCMAFNSNIGCDGPLPDSPPIIARAVAGCSNHNSVGETAAREMLEKVMADALSKVRFNLLCRASCLSGCLWC
ncbi:hypothetical protein M9H77_04658 [Catharanthus roseus]|uniref:Uncharacterized protein n=1 Tax=Catharanthus roseus TaxID=4058 RepID=A0ACC0CEV6_CATRO|nr:hypothetical protein M9H77_04658 [Catharanthus roseus]